MTDDNPKRHRLYPPSTSTGLVRQLGIKLWQDGLLVGTFAVDLPAGLPTSPATHLECEVEAMGIAINQQEWIEKYGRTR